jgi:site-specific DNA-cytosine methylase
VNVIDLFSGGAGGWTLGLHRAGFRTVAACEVDPDRRAAYSANFPSVKVYDDVRTLTADRLRADGIGAIEVVAGSPPCQDISEANATGKGIDGERSGLFWEYLRLVQELRPRWALAENVPRFRSRGYDRLHDAMEAAGYTPRPLVVGAWLLGAPHKRDRVWIVANAAGIAGRPGASRQDRAEAGERPSAADARPKGGGGGKMMSCDVMIRRQLLTPTATDNLNVPSMAKWRGFWNIRGQEVLLATYEWLMGFPPGWLASVARHMATPLSRKSPKQSAAQS